MKKKWAIIEALIILIVAAGIFIFYLYKKGKRAPEEDESILRSVPNDVELSDPEPEPLPDEETIDPEIRSQLEKAEEEKSMEEKKDSVSVDIIVFAGQSNMAGYGGDHTKVPLLTEGAGGEFRSVSDPARLYTIIEPFGFYENTAIMNDFFLKRGSLVTAFINAYYRDTGVPVVAVSASKGGTPSTYWAADAVLSEVEGRFLRAKQWLADNGYQVRNQFLVFLQGENDCLENISTEQYLTDINVFSSRMFYSGIDKFLMIRIGQIRGYPDSFARIRDVQTELCRTDPRFVLISTGLSAFGPEHMIDDYHFDQDALNLVGEEAGTNAAYFANTRHDPIIIDYATKVNYVPIDYDGL